MWDFGIFVWIWGVLGGFLGVARISLGLWEIL